MCAGCGTKFRSWTLERLGRKVAAHCCWLVEASDG
jgi:hypothetical protein